VDSSCSSHSHTPRCRLFSAGSAGWNGQAADTHPTRLNYTVFSTTDQFKHRHTFLVLYKQVKMRNANLSVVLNEWKSDPHIKETAYSEGVPGRSAGEIASGLSNRRMTERRGQVINTPSYSGGPGFKSRHGDRLSWLKCSWFFVVLSGKCEDSALNRPRPPPSTSF
jgi:hypothetical protein